MIAFEKKTNEVEKHISDGNMSLGFRRLTDCVLDTGQLEWYKDFINLYDWKERNEDAAEDVKEKTLSFLNRLKNVEIAASLQQDVLL
ncbi:MAG: hypothetical protein ACK5NK_02180, partial [Niabella sp.]